MSAFLGRIHYWLFNKIQLHEKFIDDIGGVGVKKGFNIEEIKKESFKRFGYPVKGALEDEIEHSNIHGWLQESIASVEKRLAYLVTALLKGGVKKEEIAEVLIRSGEKQGKEIKEEYDIKNTTPQDIFTMIFDYMLEGMPCDRVNEIIEDNDKKLSWRNTRCLHKEYWEEVNGDVNVFYYLKESWITSFVESTGGIYKYSIDENGINTIRKG